MSRRVPKPLPPIAVGLIAGALALWTISPSEAGTTQPGGSDNPPATTVHTTPPVERPTTAPASVPALPAAVPSGIATFPDDFELPNNYKYKTPSIRTTPGGECTVCI